MAKDFILYRAEHDFGANREEIDMVRNIINEYGYL
jgi:hypothetical protein